MKNKLLAGLASGLCIIVFAGIAGASTIRSAASVTANTMGEWDSTTSINNVSNQSSLSANFLSGVTDFDSYFVGDPTHAMEYANNEWWSSENFTGYIDFDLGDTYLLDRIALWNEDAVGISSFDLYTSTVITFASSIFGGNFSPTDNPINSAYPADIFSLISPTVARYVRIDILGAQDTASDIIGMGEIAFSTAPSPVPEPATMLLLGTGLVGVASAARRKKKYQA